MKMPEMRRMAEMAPTTVVNTMLEIHTSPSFRLVAEKIRQLKS
jgi:hypothetical protein